MEERMEVKRYINLTNGIEWTTTLAGSYSFIRIQSTACEQKRWDNLLLDLDNDLLMNLALGNACIIYDASKCEVSRAMWQGVEFIKYVLNKVWFDVEIKCPKGQHAYFKTVLKELTRSTLKKVKYYRKFLNTNEILITYKSKTTKNDGQYLYFNELIKESDND